MKITFFVKYTLILSSINTCRSLYNSDTNYTVSKNP